MAICIGRGFCWAAQLENDLSLGNPFKNITSIPGKIKHTMNYN